MFDRFKFRAWHKEKQEMHNIDGLYAYDSEYTEGGEVFFKEDSNPKNSYYFPEEVELMQCTGLKDKNGKLIYEGDIVKNNQNSLYSVEFEEFEHQTKFCLKRIENPNYYPHISTWQGIGYKDQKNYEVIGNIYENKDLLNENS